MKNILFLIFIFFNSLIYAQLNVKVDFYKCRNYDFDLNQATGALINQHNAFLIDYNSEGIGKFIFLSNIDDIYQDTKKYKYDILDVSFGTYTSGERYIKLKCLDFLDRETEILLTLKTKNNKQIISQIAIINEDNEGALFW
ncbi:MAG TPA: hypothetical protein PLJ42_09015 [Chitinophagales bacterium]|nr:hypothetical protein [Chitinophagales bacterium]HQW79562.1 hypothetical protein [Chitinophagales bacterium]